MKNRLTHVAKRRDWCIMMPFLRPQMKFRLKDDIEFRQTDHTYTVQPDDNLSKVSTQFYGDPNTCKKIADANKLEGPDKIKAGQQLIIPPA